ncbi:MAG: hypothetical protein QM767_03170 [Anaeromyxobacter sp.]
MHAVRLSELRELLASPAFHGWWEELVAATAGLREARARHEDLTAQGQLMELRAEVAQRSAIDAFSAAGAAEDEAAHATADAQSQENRALERVGSFEEQRFRTSDLWYRLGGAERTVEVRREALAGLPAPQPSPGPRGADGEKARATAEAALRAAERQQQALQEEYGQEDRKRARLWDEVEAAWARSFERSLLSAEHAIASRRARRDAERLFKEAEERRGRARQLRAEAEEAGRAVAEAERTRAGLLGAARERFGCVAGDLFLYWRHREDQRAAFAVALGTEPEGGALPVKPLEIYTVGRSRGVAQLEPAREGLALTLEAGDRRFDEYFLGARHAAPEPAGQGREEP